METVVKHLRCTHSKEQYTRGKHVLVNHEQANLAKILYHLINRDVKNVNTIIDVKNIDTVLCIHHSNQDVDNIEITLSTGHL